MLAAISELLSENSKASEEELLLLIRKLVRTGQVSASSKQDAPLVVIAEPDAKMRQELGEHFAGRLQLRFVANIADLPRFISNQPVSAAIIHQSRFEARLISQIRGAQSTTFPIIAHGTSMDVPVDRRVVNNLTPALLEIIIWEEITRCDSFNHHKSKKTSRAPVRVKSANLSDEEIAARSTWKELLNSEVSLSNIKRLLIKEVSS